MITVFTPSYNRRKELEALYKSLLKQKKCEFEWLIVDDGSSDNTKEYISKLKSDNKININYVYKKNGGKQSAYNRGLKEAKGDIFLCIDSDDILCDNVLKEIDTDFKEISDNDDICGIAYAQSYISDKDKVIGTLFPSDGLVDTYFNIYHKHKVTGDKLIVLKTSVAKSYDFPLIKGEKFVPEALVFNRIALKYKLKCSNKIMACKEYLDSGYSNNYFDLVKRNPNGNRLYFREVYDLEKSFYNVYGYILFSVYAKVGFRKILMEHPSKFKVVLLYIPTLIISWIRR